MRLASVLLLGAALSLPGCAAIMVADTAADAAVFTTKTAVRGTVGAGRLAARGTGAVVGAGRGDD